MKRTSVLLLIISFLASFVLIGQVSTSSVTGSVVDASGAVVPGAKVQVKNEDTGVVFDGVTNASGNYSFASLPPGPYTITV